MPSTDSSTQYDAIPADLKGRAQWVAWRFEDDPKQPQKRKKRPLNPKYGSPASHSDPDTWGSFSDAVTAVAKFGADGIGYVFSRDDPYCGFDFDNIVSKIRYHPDSEETTLTEDWAKEALHLLGVYGYTEDSVSGSGIHVIVKGTLPRHTAKQSYLPANGTVEAYERDRFFVVTGDGSASETLFGLNGGQANIEKAWALLGLTESGDAATGGANGPYVGATVPSGLSVEEAIDKARKATTKNGEKFRALFDDGNLSDYGGDASRADFALIGLLAFWLGNDPNAIDEAFRKSKLYRPKWGEIHGNATYGLGSIGRLLRARVAAGKPFYGQGKEAFSQDFFSQRDGETTTGGDATFKLYTIGEYRQRPTPKWLIKGIVREGTLAALIAEHGGFKTFIGLDFGLSTALGRPCFGFNTTQTPVLYIAGEGGGMMIRRIDAWKKHHAITDDPADFFLLPEAVQMLESSQTDKLDRTIDKLGARPGLIFIDTLARSFIGGNENQQEDMNKYIAAAGRLQTRYGATVIILHHMNRQGGYRGSSALPGALDTMIEMEKTSDGVRLRCQKQKDDEPFRDIRLQKIVVTLGESVDLSDDDAPFDLDAATSLVFVPVGTTDLLKPNERKALQALGTAATEWVNHGGWAALSGIAAGPLHRIVPTLKHAGYIDVDDRGAGKSTYYRITDQGKAILEPAGTPFARGEAA